MYTKWSAYFVGKSVGIYKHYHTNKLTDSQNNALQKILLKNEHQAVEEQLPYTPYLVYNYHVQSS